MSVCVSVCVCFHARQKGKTGGAPIKGLFCIHTTLQFIRQADAYELYLKSRQTCEGIGVCKCVCVCVWAGGV